MYPGGLPLPFQGPLCGKTASGFGARQWCVTSPLVLASPHAGPMLHRPGPADLWWGPGWGAVGQAHCCLLDRGAPPQPAEESWEELPPDSCGVTIRRQGGLCTSTNHQGLLKASRRGILNINAGHQGVLTTRVVHEYICQTQSSSGVRQKRVYNTHCRKPLHLGTRCGCSALPVPWPRPTEPDMPMGGNPLGGCV